MDARELGSEVQKLIEEKREKWDRHWRECRLEEDVRSFERFSQAVRKHCIPAPKPARTREEWLRRIKGDE